MKIGVVSDTHGNIHPKVFDHLEGVNMILHAGDIGGEDVLAELETIAPVKAVLGNTDTFPMTKRFKAREIMEICGRKVYLTHRVLEGIYKLSKVMEEINREGPDIVVFGHTHEQYSKMIEGILFFNPGSAGQKRPGKRLGAGILNLEDGKIGHKIYFLE